MVCTIYLYPRITSISNTSSSGIYCLEGIYNLIFQTGTLLSMKGGVIYNYIGKQV